MTVPQNMKKDVYVENLVMRACGYAELAFIDWYDERLQEKIYKLFPYGCTVSLTIK